jgi:hypothetical protein
MVGKAVTLMIRFKDDEGTWKRRPAARGANGRVKPGHALSNDKIVPVKNWTYDLRYTAGINSRSRLRMETELRVLSNLPRGLRI